MSPEPLAAIENGVQTLIDSEGVRITKFEAAIGPPHEWQAEVDDLNANEKPDWLTDQCDGLRQLAEERGAGLGHLFSRLRHRTTRTVLPVLAACSILFGGSYLAGEASNLQQTAPSLGAASSFAVLGGQTVTNTGPTTVGADLGVSPGSAVTGFPPGAVVGGSIHAADALAGQAQSATTTAYNVLAGQPCTGNLTGQDLGGMTLTAGVYCFSSSAQLTGALTLNAQGNANAVFIFQIGSTLTTASGSSVSFINGGSPCNVYWQVGSSAIVGTTTAFVGNILALTSISLNTGASVSGRALARNGSVTMDNNTVGSAGCAVGVATATPTATLLPSTATAIPALPPAAIPALPPVVIPVLPPTTQNGVSGGGSSAGTAATATAIATLPPATQTAVVAATATAVTASTATAIAATPEATPTSDATPTSEATPTSQPTPTGLPPALPRTGGGPPSLGLLFLLLGGLAAVTALTVRQARR